MKRSSPAVSNTDLFSDDNLLRMDETVREVFGTMLGMEVAAEPLHPPLCPLTGAQREQGAQIDFAGAISGHCEINLSRNASAAIASAMLGGVDIDAESGCICDAIGELCNMLAGGWKDRLPDLAANCQLSIPVKSCAPDPGRISGLNSALFPDLFPGLFPDLRVSRRSYTFGEEHTLMLTLAQARP